MPHDIGKWLAIVIGMTTVTLSLLVKIVGEPDQILKNFRRRSTNGLSRVNYVIGFLAYTSWVAHGFVRRDPVIIVSQSLGVLTTAIILLQFAVYRQKPDKSVRTDAASSRQSDGGGVW